MFMLCLTTLPLYAGEGITSRTDHQQRVIEVARKVIEAAGVSALITIDQEGQPRARTVASFVPDDGFVVWIATRPVTRKVIQITQNNRVTLYYFDTVTNSYVTLMGTAELVDDVATKTAMRREQDGPRFYPGFPDDYLLIKVTPQSMEVLGGEFRGDPETWQPEIVNLSQ